MAYGLLCILPQDLPKLWKHKVLYKAHREMNEWVLRLQPQTYMYWVVARLPSSQWNSHFFSESSIPLSSKMHQALNQTINVSDWKIKRMKVSVAWTPSAEGTWFRSSLNNYLFINMMHLISSTSWVIPVFGALFLTPSSLLGPPSVNNEVLQL